MSQSILDNLTIKTIYRYTFATTTGTGTVYGQFYDIVGQKIGSSISFTVNASAQSFYNLLGYAPNAANFSFVTAIPLILSLNGGKNSSYGTDAFRINLPLGRYVIGEKSSNISSGNNVITTASIIASSTGPANLAFSTNTLKRKGVIIPNPDSTNKLLIYIQSDAIATLPVVGTTIPTYWVPTQSTLELEMGDKVNIFVGASASTITFSPKEVLQ